MGSGWRLVVLSKLSFDMENFHFRLLSSRHEAGSRAAGVSMLKKQCGVTLVELMVGIAIGLLVVAVALGAIMASRSISGTVSETSLLQQQAAHAFRVMGQQIRQAGSIELNLNPNIALTAASGTNAAMTPVAFDAPDPTGVRPTFDRPSSTLTGVETPLSFTTGFQNYTESITPITSPVVTSLLRDCLGQNPALSPGGSVSTTPVLMSKFERKEATNELVCTGSNAASAQPIIGNVTDMQVRYLEQLPSTTSMQYRTSPPSTGSTVWKSIYAVEVCLELTGTEPVPTTDATYTNCSGNATAYGERLRMVFRNTFQIRSQGQV